jgi:predicted negative regulator of RcsB-dependent stress response
MALELELKGKHYDRALARLDRMAAQYARKEQWLVRRGEILQQAGRKREAREAFEAAIHAIGLLPAHQRRTGAMIKLENRARSMLR